MSLTCLDYAIKLLLYVYSYLNNFFSYVFFYVFTYFFIFFEEIKLSFRISFYKTSSALNPIGFVNCRLTDSGTSC